MVLEEIKKDQWVLKEMGETLLGRAKGIGNDTRMKSVGVFPKQVRNRTRTDSIQGGRKRQKLTRGGWEFVLHLLISNSQIQPEVKKDGRWEDLREKYNNGRGCAIREASGAGGRMRVVRKCSIILEEIS